MYLLNALQENEDVEKTKFITPLVHDNNNETNFLLHNNHTCRI